MSQSGDIPEPGFVDPFIDGLLGGESAYWSFSAGDPPAGLDPFQCRQARFVDRAVYFEKVIAWAQAGKAQTLAEAWQYTSGAAESGRPLAGPGRQHDWDATFAAQQGLIAEMACALRIPYGTACGLIQQSRALVEDRPQTLAARRSACRGRMNRAPSASSGPM